MAQEVENPIFARFFHRFCGGDRGTGERELRRELLAGARERVVDELRFYEHVRSRRPGFARWQRRIDRFWSRAMGGCHTDRDTLAAIADAGFRVERCRGVGFPADARAYPVAPRILGLARAD